MDQPKPRSAPRHSLFPKTSRRQRRLGLHGSKPLPMQVMPCCWNSRQPWPRRSAPSLPRIVRLISRLSQRGIVGDGRGTGHGIAPLTLTSWDRLPAALPLIGPLHRDLKRRLAQVILLIEIEAEIDQLWYEELAVLYCLTQRIATDVTFNSMHSWKACEWSRTAFHRSDDGKELQTLRDAQSHIRERFG